MYTEGEILQLLGDNIDGIPIFEEECMVGNVKTASTSGHCAAAVGFEQAVVLLSEKGYNEWVHLWLQTHPLRNGDPS